MQLDLNPRLLFGAHRWAHQHLEAAKDLLTELKFVIIAEGNNNTGLPATYLLLVFTEKVEITDSFKQKPHC